VTKEEEKIAKASFVMVQKINKEMIELIKKHDQKFAEMVYNTIAFTMVTRLAVAIAEADGKDAFDHYWSDISVRVKGIVESFACEPTKH
jgi:adenine-specific DNA methylase